MNANIKQARTLGFISAGEAAWRTGSRDKASNGLVQIASFVGLTTEADRPQIRIIGSVQI